MIEARLRAIVEGLNRSRVRYLVVGPLAVAAHGCVPQTAHWELSLVLGEGSMEWGLRLGRGGQGEIDVNVMMADVLDFDEMYARREEFELAAGVAVSVCGYGDLVRLKRESGTACDLADLDQLEKVRRVRPAHDPWYECTFEGSELWGLWRWADLTFAEKIAWLEEAHQLALKFQENRRKMGLATIYPDGRIE